MPSLGSDAFIVARYCSVFTVLLADFTVLLDGLVVVLARLTAHTTSKTTSFMMVNLHYPVIVTQLFAREGDRRSSTPGGRRRGPGGMGAVGVCGERHSLSHPGDR